MFTRAELAEVLAGLGHRFGEELHLDAAERLAWENGQSDAESMCFRGGQWDKIDERSFS